MSSWQLWGAFTTAQTVLILSCVFSKAPEIQAELQQRSVLALQDAGVDLGSGLVMDGRDAWLAGNLADPDARARAEQAVSRIRGVRSVHNLLLGGEMASTHPIQEAPPPVEIPPPTARKPEAPAPEPPKPEAKQPDPPSPPPAAAPAPKAQASTSDLQRSINDLIGDRIVDFAPSSARLTQGGGALVDEVAAFLEQNPDLRIEIGGHTDSQGTSRNNLIISQRRAEAVRRRLVDAGVAASRLTAKGYGEDRPIADNGTRAGRVKNRRVEFTVQ